KGGSIVNRCESPWTSTTGLANRWARLLSAATSEVSDEPLKGSSCHTIITAGAFVASAWLKAAFSQATLAVWRADVSPALGLLLAGPGTSRVANTTAPFVQRAFST